MSLPTLGLADGARLINIHPGTLRERAAAGIIPGAKIGRAWVFIEADLLEYLRSSYRPCLSTSAKTAISGGRTSVTLASGYAGQLAKLIEQRRKSATVSSR